MKQLYQFPPYTHENTVYNWTRQTALFALMVQAKRAGKDIPEKFVLEAFEQADRVFDRTYKKMGPVPPSGAEAINKWLTDFSDEVFAWVDSIFPKPESASPKP